MIEPIMYFGIGFFVAALVGLVVVPLVHNRAVRLTMRRLEAATPLSMAEIQADKDQLRAEFAMSTRRLEVAVEGLRTKSTSQLAELGKKGDAINRLKIELGEKTATIFALEARDKALRDQLRVTEEEFAVKTSAMLDAQRALTEKEAEVARVLATFDEQANINEAQKVELVALKTQVEALKGRVDEANNELRIVEDRRDAERVELKAATQELTEERGKVENLGRRVGELEHALVAQTTEAEILGRRAADMENRLGEQMRLLAESDAALKQMRGDMETARKTESDLRAAVAELDARASAATQQLRTENGQLLAELEKTRDERDRALREMSALKRETEENWNAERIENSLMRERINDVAAEIARLASALEGPNSPIDAILAAETARDQAVASPGAPGALTTPEAGGHLADRIRALQTQASRLAADEQKVPN
jgi:DNA repair exonuclease SbcCD ATPase subunit